MNISIIISLHNQVLIVWMNFILKVEEEDNEFL